jgi:hypothetical protein
MNLDRLDHIAIEVADLGYCVELLVRTGGMKVLRRGTAMRTGTRMAMVGEPTSMKVELVENRDAAGAPRFLHVAFRSSDVGAAARSLVGKGWKWQRSPIELEEAQARSVLLSDNGRFELQVMTYRPTRPDIVEWSDDETA